jgi:hypothetical protein
MPKCTISGHQSCEASILLLRPKMMFRSVSEHFDVKRCKTCVSVLYALFRGTKVAKHPFYSIAPKMIYGSVTENFANLRHVIRWKLVFRSCMHYFGVPMLRSIHSTPLDRKWYMGVLPSTSLTLCTLKYENFRFVLECTISGYQSWEASILLHWTQNDIWECYRGLR